MTQNNLKICYLVGKFPSLSETFILQEVEHHLAAGASIRVVSMFSQADPEQLARLPPNLRCTIVNVFDRSSIARAVTSVLRVLAYLFSRPGWWPVIFGPGFGTARDRFRIAGLASTFARRAYRRPVTAGERATGFSKMSCAP
jgi:hypothetical protein